jgi:hypothetical protein
VNNLQTISHCTTPNKERAMFTPPIPPPNPDEHLMHERNRQQAAQREARSGRTGMHLRGLSTGDMIIFAVLAVAVLAGLWFLISWLSP